MVRSGRAAVGAAPIARQAAQARSSRSNRPSSAACSRAGRALVAAAPGLDALLDAIENLQGAPLPASIFESEILAARVEGYNPADLEYANVQTFIRFLFSTNLSEVLVVALGFFAAFALNLREPDGALLLPLTAAQLLWINLVTDGAPALALAVDRTPGVMQRPPRPMSSPLLDRASLRFIVLSASFKALCAFGMLGLLPRVGVSLEGTRTATFLFMATGQLLFAYPARRSDLQPEPNLVLLGAILLGVLLQLPIALLPNARAAFDVAPLSPALWGLVALAALVAWAGAELAGKLVWRR